MTTEITLTPAERERLRDQLSDYCSEHFELELEQFDAEFLSISLSINWARPFTTPGSRRRFAPI